MTTKRIAYERPDGGVDVITPNPRKVAQLVADGMTEAEAVEHIRQKDVPTGAAKVAIMEEVDLPPRSERDRWRLS